jgi:hypothetical protein
MKPLFDAARQLDMKHLGSSKAKGLAPWQRVFRLALICESGITTFACPLSDGHSPERIVQYG